MSTAATIAVAIVSSGAFSAIVTAACNALTDRGKRKRERDARDKALNERLDSFDEQLKEIKEHELENYLTGLRLTIMSNDMPMGERLIAGKKYIDLGGNGDVKHFLKELEKRCESR